MLRKLGSRMAHRQQQQEQNQQHRRAKRRVRFGPGTLPEYPEKRKIRKRKQALYNGQSTLDANGFLLHRSDRWYTKRELKDIQQSCLLAVRTRAFMSSLAASSPLGNNNNNIGGGGLSQQKQQQQQSSSSFGSSSTVDHMLLDRFSDRSRKRRKLVRWQMLETTRAVQAFEKLAGLKLPTKLLRDLLGLYSRPMEQDAFESASAVAIEEHPGCGGKTTTTPRTTSTALRLPVCHSHHKAAIAAIPPPTTTSLAAEQPRDDTMDATLECARRLLERSLKTRSPSPPQAAAARQVPKMPIPQDLFRSR